MRETIKRFHGMRRAEKRAALADHLHDLWGVTDEKATTLALDQVDEALGFAAPGTMTARALMVVAKAAAAIMTVIESARLALFPGASQHGG